MVLNDEKNNEKLITSAVTQPKLQAPLIHQSQSDVPSVFEAIGNKVPTPENPIIVGKLVQKRSSRWGFGGYGSYDQRSSSVLHETERPKREMHAESRQQPQQEEFGFGFEEWDINWASLFPQFKTVAWIAGVLALVVLYVVVILNL